MDYGIFALSEQCTCQSIGRTRVLLCDARMLHSEQHFAPLSCVKRGFVARLAHVSH
jgi:hypothetical protein